MMIHLAVDDARTAQEAGARFARALAGATTAAFMLALAEQEELIRHAIIKAGFTAEQARLTAEHFDMAARAEWERIASRHESEDKVTQALDDNWDRGWSTDENGNQVRVGLTLAETTEYADLQQAAFAMKDYDRRRYLELYGKHERTRLQLVTAEVERRNIRRLQ